LIQSGAEGRAVTHVQPDCRIYLVVEAGPAAIEDLSAALSAADVACCLIVPATGEGSTARTAKPIVEAAQRAGVAALLANDVDLARTVRADGVHLEPVRSLPATYAAVRETLGRDAIVGADAGLSRHDAMSLAEAGADYIAFGAPAHVMDRDRARQRRDDLVSWWGEIFEVSCVALDVETPAEADRLARAGANFVAVRLVAGDPASSRELVTRIGAALGAGAAAG
jgi:thiamine-phosphate pyrophosphorylase